MGGVENDNRNGRKSLGLEEIKVQMMKAISEVLPQAIESHKVATEERLVGIKEEMREKMVKNVDTKENRKVQVKMDTRLKV